MPLPERFDLVERVRHDDGAGAGREGVRRSGEGPEHVDDDDQALEFMPVREVRAPEVHRDGRAGYAMNGFARSSNSSSPGSLGFHGLPGWMIATWHASAASTISL